MIGKLYGVVEDIEEDSIILNVNDVGYIVHVMPSILKKLAIGDKTSLFIETQMREDQVKLYGFQSKIDLTMLRTLIKVKGVSHKIAANIINDVPLNQIIQGIVSKNPTLLKANSVGPKLANRIITELEGVIEKRGIEPDDSLTNDAISALINLGYSANESYDLIKTIRAQVPNLTNINELIKQALKYTNEK